MNELQSKAFWERFNKYVDKTSSCWNWTGAKTKAGYGLITIILAPKKPKQFYTHRLAAGAKYKLQPKDYVCHSCDNPACVNPDHLWLGTAKDNAQDMVLKGRHKSDAKLTLEQVKEIRSSYKPWITTQGMLAKKYGVSSGCIQGIVDGVNWRKI